MNGLTPSRLVKTSAAVALLTLLAVAAWLLREAVLPPQEMEPSVTMDANGAELKERGAYLVRAGNCMACHSARGGQPFAGGRGIDTPFGTVYSSNLTPDRGTGLGNWSSSDFWRALHHGRSKDGRLLYPAFPYTNYTQVTRADADAMFAYLQSLQAVAAPTPAHTLSWPFNTQAALSAWRALYFSPGVFVPESAQSPEWNRGAYLVRGLGHCAACHSARDALGGSRPLDLAGGLIPMQNWYAPSLSSNAEAGVADWPVADIVALLKAGSTPRASVLGPMAEVVLHSTQHMSDADLQAMAVFLKALPQTRESAPELTAASRGGAKPLAQAASATARAGGKLYETQCAQCHGERGEGVPGAYPALAGNRAVTLASPANLVQIVLNGGYAPATAGNPRPYGMPPFLLVLNDNETAQLLTFLRSAWGNSAAEVTPLDVNRARNLPQ
jgi:mono/diheme cytochrome c family protein